MTQRLPIPGQDSGDWGDILNSFLEVSLASDGTINSGVVGSSQLSTSSVTSSAIASNAVGTNQLANNSVTNAQLDVPTQTTLATVASKYTKPSSGIPASDLTTAVQTNLTSASTSVQPSTTLTGDLSGTIASPVVAKINGVAMPSGAPNTGQVIQATSTNATNWATISSTTVSDATSGAKGIIQLDGDLGGTAASPTVTTIGGHTPVTTVTTLTGGDLTGTLPSPTVAKVNGVAVTGTPSSGQVITASSSSAAAWSTPAAGAGNATSSAPGLIQLDGDLSGTAASPSVVSIKGITLPSSTPSAGNVLTATGSTATAWTTPAAGVTLDSTASDIQADTITGTAVAGSSSYAAKADHQHPLVSHDHSTVNQGGQLTATTGLNATGTPSSTTYLRGDNSWSVTPAASSATTSSLGVIELAGDLSGTATSPTVTTSSGLPIVTTTGTQTLTNKSISGSQITSAVATATTATSANTANTVTTIPALSGDVTSSGSSNATTVAKISGISLPSSAPTSGNVLTATSGTATAWSTPAAGVMLDSTAADIQPLGTQTAGSSGKAADASHIHTMPRLDQVNAPTAAVALNSQKITGLANGTAPTDAAAYGQVPNVSTTAVGGDLSGTVGTATVAKVNGITITGTPSANQVLTASSTTAAAWATLSSSSLNAAQALTPTAVKTSAYTASPGDFIPVDTSGGNVTITLPSAPTNNTRVEIKMINTTVNVTNGYGNNIVTFSTGGSDVFNKASGPTSGYLTLLNQAVMLQYAASPAIWYVQSDDLPQSSVPLGLSHTVTTTYTMTSTDHVVMADATSAAFTITLPTAVGYSGVYNIEAITSTTNIVTLSTTSSQTIEAASTTSLGTNASGALYSSVTLVSDGANWRIL